MTASGCVGTRRRARSLPVPVRARRGGREVARRLRVAGQPAASAASGDRRDVEQRRAAGPRSGEVAPRRPAPTRAAGARVVASIWARTVDDYGLAAKMLVNAPRCVVAVEVNLSCPNLDGGAHLFAHSPEATTRGARAPRRSATGRCWAKLSPNTDRLVEVERRAGRGRRRRHAREHGAGDGHRRRDRRRPALGAGGGRAVGPRHPSRRGARRPRRARRRARPPDRRRRRCRDREPTRSELMIGGRVRGAGRHGDLRGPEGSAFCAARAERLVRTARDRCRHGDRGSSA